MNPDANQLSEDDQHLVLTTWFNALPSAQHLQTFLAVIDAGGTLSTAARQIGMSQPGVTHQINELEKRLNARLFDRARGRAARLTRAGRAVERHARKIVQLQASMLHDLDSMRRVLVGDLRVGASPGPGEHWLPPRLCEFRRAHEDVHVELHVADARTIVESVFDNDLELGFVGGRWSRSGLEFIPVTGDRLCFIAAPSHPLAKRKRLDVDDLTGLDFIAQEPGSGVRVALDSELEERNLSLRRFNVIAELGNQESVKSAVRAGHGIGCVWASAVEAELAVGSLAMLSLRDFEPDSHMYAVRRSSRLLSRNAESFLHYVVEESTMHAQADTSA